MRAVIIRPWRAGDPWREQAREYSDRWWRKHGYEIVEVEHPGPEPFSRSWALNEGARRAWPWDVAMFIDADVMEGEDRQVHEGFRAALMTGRMVVPHTSGKDLSREGTEMLYTGKRFSWDQYLEGMRKVCDSRANVVRADLFEKVGGFDERFRGWGHEDVAFFAACQVFTGRARRLKGTSWHLWHENMLEKSRPTAEWQEGSTLVRRYLLAERRGATAMTRVLRERPPNIVWKPPTKTVNIPVALDRPRPKGGVEVDLIVLTSGRKEYLSQTIASASQMVTGNVISRTILDDSGSPSIARWLVRQFPDFNVVHHGRNLGFTESVRRGWARITRTPGAPYVLWLEDDFIFEREVFLDDLATLLDAEPPLAQVALLRRPYYRPELNAGSIINQNPDSYVRKEHEGLVYLEHDRYFTTNPHLMKREIAKVGWPRERDSEQVATRKLLDKGFKFAYLGEGEPWIRHIGKTRRGKGY